MFSCVFVVSYQVLQAIARKEKTTKCASFHSPTALSDFVAFYSYMKGDCNDVEVNLLPQVTRQDKEMASSYTRGSLVWILGKT